MRTDKKLYSLMFVPAIMILFFVSVSSMAFACPEPGDDGPQISLKIVSPTPNNVPPIDITPKMPTINFQANLNGADPGSYTFKWTGELSYKWKNRYKGEQTKTFKFEKETYGSVGTSWTPDFQEVMGEDVMGGNMVVTVSTTVGGTPYSNTETFKIGGTNPNKEIIKAELGNLKYQILAYRETVVDKYVWMQFSIGSANGDNPIGEPTFGPPSGYGLMKLDPVPSYKQLWNWKANIKTGVQEFKRKYNDAEQLDNKYKTYYNKIGMTEEAKLVESLNPEQALTQAYFAYNAGDPSQDGMKHTYWQWDTTTTPHMWTNTRAVQNYPVGVLYADVAMKNYKTGGVGLRGW